jgi:hypothetical protein
LELNEPGILNSYIFIYITKLYKRQHASPHLPRQVQLD